MIKTIQSVLKKYSSRHSLDQLEKYRDNGSRRRPSPVNMLTTNKRNDELPAASSSKTDKGKQKETIFSPREERSTVTEGETVRKRHVVLSDDDEDERAPKKQPKVVHSTVVSEVQRKKPFDPTEQARKDKEKKRKERLRQQQKEDEEARALTQEELALKSRNLENMSYAAKLLVRSLIARFVCPRQRLTCRNFAIQRSGTHYQTASTSTATALPLAASVKLPRPNPGSISSWQRSLPKRFSPPPNDLSSNIATPSSDQTLPGQASASLGGVSSILTSTERPFSVSKSGFWPARTRLAYHASRHVAQLPHARRQPETQPVATSDPRLSRKSMA